MEYIIAFDLSMSNTGVAIFSDDARLIAVESVATKSDELHQRRLKRIADRMIELKNLYRPTKIIIEKGFFRFMASSEAIWKVNGVCQYIFWDIEQIQYAPASVKKAVGGKGNMKKEEIRDVVSKMFANIEISDEDQSDAVSVGLCFFMKEGII